MGWEADPFGLHELRYFSQGEPTRLVKDGKVEAYDEPPASGVRHTTPAAVPAAPGAPAPHLSPPRQASPRDVAAAPPAPPPPLPRRDVAPPLPGPTPGEPHLLAEFRAAQMAPPPSTTPVAPIAYTEPAPAGTASNGGSPNGWHPEPPGPGPRSASPAPPPVPASPQWTAAPTSPIRPHHARAHTVSRVFGVACWVVLVLGVILGIVTGVEVHAHGGSAGSGFLATVVVIGGAVLGAAALAFFSCVLDLLIAIDTETAAGRERTGP